MLLQSVTEGPQLPMSLYQVIAWIEDKEARILRVEAGIHHEATIVAPDSADSLDTPASEGETPGEANGYFHKVARALDLADEILIVGPSAIKLEFVQFMHKNDHAYDPRILGVETVDHPTDHQLAGYAKLYFTDGGPRRAGNGSGFRENR